MPRSAAPKRMPSPPAAESESLAGEGTFNMAPPLDPPPEENVLEARLERIDEEFTIRKRWAIGGFEDGLLRSVKRTKEILDDLSNSRAKELRKAIAESKCDKDTSADMTDNYKQVLQSSEEETSNKFWIDSTLEQAKFLMTHDMRLLAPRLFAEAACTEESGVADPQDSVG